MGTITAVDRGELITVNVGTPAVGDVGVTAENNILGPGFLSRMSKNK